MPAARIFTSRRPSLSLALLIMLLAVLLLAGGASRGDVAGQVVVRLFAVAILILVALFGRVSSIPRARPIWVLLLASIAVTLVQLVPLPSAVLATLPGREGLLDAASLGGTTAAWRPWSVVPGATINAAVSLLVPFSALTVVNGLRDDERARLPGILIAVVGISAVVGLMQFVGFGFRNPLINETAGQISGSFANRNHFALFLAMGCLLVPAWAFSRRRSAGWRAPVGFGLAILLTLTVLASGSRAGLLLNGVALVLGLIVARREIRQALSRAPRWMLPAVVIGMVGTMAVVVGISVAADRAVSVQRAFAIDPGQDMRGRGLETVISMISTYWPAGFGLGGFDTMFRMHEPAALLKPTYFNHAHNDYLEIVAGAGAAGALLLAGGLAWWAWATIRVVREGLDAGDLLARLGAAIIFLVLVASVFDYPARTPMIMTMLIVAATWLSSGVHKRRSALPVSGHDL